MIKDNMEFTQAELYPNRVEIVGTYSVDFSLNTGKVELDNGGKEMKYEMKKILIEQCRRVIIADALDVPFLKLLYKEDALKQLVINSLDIVAFQKRIDHRGSKEKYEEIRMLEEVIYALRTLPNKECKK